MASFLCKQQPKPKKKKLTGRETNRRRYELAKHRERRYIKKKKKEKYTSKQHAFW